MSSETIEVNNRDAVGSAACRKLRQMGHVPAVLYGHGEENVNLSVAADRLGRVIEHGSKVLTLTGAVKETALLRDVQWDAFGIEVLHVDLTRVSQSETVDVTLPVELHGEAPGTNEGGILAFSLHEVAISCPASNIPEHIEVNIGNLHIGQAIHASEISLPEGASLVTPPEEVIVQVNKPAGAAAADDEPAGGSEAEPEVISKGKDDEAESE